MKKICKLILLTFILCTTLSSCSDTDTPKENLDENINDGKIIEEIKDENGNIIKQVMEMEDGAIIEYEYDENGNITAMCIKASDGSYEEVTYNENGNRKTYIYIDTNGEKLSHSYHENGSIFVEQKYGKDGSYESYTYDEEGKMMIQITQDGTKSTYTYHPNGKIASAVIEEANRVVVDEYDESEKKIHTSIKYNGGVIAEVTYHNNGMKHIVNTFYTDGSTQNEVWSEDGMKCETTHSDGTKFVSTYHLNGKIKTDTIYYPDNRVDEYVYYENGNTKTLTVTLEDGTVYEYKYNEDGTEQK